MCFVCHVVLIRSQDRIRIWPNAVLRIMARAGVVYSGDPEFLPITARAPAEHQQPNSIYFHTPHFRQDPAIGLMPRSATHHLGRLPQE
jgi:hypothetical protein